MENNKQIVAAINKPPPNKSLQATPLRSRNVGNFRHPVLSDQIVVFVVGGAPELSR
jgi:hypothetical protein